MLRKLKWCLEAITTALILLLACKMSTDIADESRRIVGGGFEDYGYQNVLDISNCEIQPEEIVKHEVQAVCEQTEDIALWSMAEMIQEGGE